MDVSKWRKHQGREGERKGRRKEGRQGGKKRRGRKEKKMPIKSQ